MNDITDFFGEPISVYTSEQAEADGILVKTGHPLINYMTHTVYKRLIEPFVTEDIDESALTKKLIEDVIIEIRKYLRSGKKEDWFYSVKIRDCKLFCTMNETGKFTLMFPEDY